MAPASSPRRSSPLPTHLTPCPVLPRLLPTKAVWSSYPWTKPSALFIALGQFAAEVVIRSDPEGIEAGATFFAGWAQKVASYTCDLIKRERAAGIYGPYGPVNDDERDADG